VSQWYPHFKEIKTVLHFAKYGSYSEPFVWSKAQLEAIENELLTRIEIVEARTTWDLATPHKGCTYCPHIFKCPAKQEALTVDESGNVRVNKNTIQILGDTNKAAWVAGFHTVVAELEKMANDELRAFVEFAGPIAIPGKVYEIRGKTKRNWDKVNKKLRDSYYRICEKHNEDPKTYMGLSDTFSNSVWLSGNEAFVKDLAELFPEKLTTEFRGWKS
jgi:hypothetical protein